MSFIQCWWPWESSFLTILNSLSLDQCQSWLFIIMIEHIVLSDVHLYESECIISLVHIHLLLQYSALEISLLLALHLLSFNWRQRFFVACQVFNTFVQVLNNWLFTSSLKEYAESSYHWGMIYRTKQSLISQDLKSFLFWLALRLLRF